MPLIFGVEPKAIQAASGSVTDVLGAGPISVTGTTTKTVALDGDSFVYASAPAQGRIYRLNASGQLVLAQADAFANCDGIVGPFQGTANRAQNLRGKVVQVFAAAGLAGLVSPQPIFLSMATAGVVTNIDPYDAPVVGAHSVLLGFLVDASAYNALSGGLLSIVWAPLLPSPPLGTGATPPVDPPFYVDPQVYTCPSGTVAKQLLALTGTDFTLQFADATLQLPAFGRVAQVLTATTCRLYAVDLVISGGGAAAGSVYYLAAGGNETTTVPSAGSGVLIQRTAFSVAAGYMRSAIDLHGWDPNL